MHPEFLALANIRPRSRTWPLDAAGQRHPGVVAMSSSEGSDGLNADAVAEARPSQSRVSNEEENDEDPATLFLSPVHMYEYDDWSDSTDDENEEIDWDAGITDFALYDDDRRRARDTGAALPGRWNGLLSSQASALQRSRERSLAWSLLTERDGATTATQSERDHDDSLPALTPDASPHLHDDLDDSDPNLASQTSSSAPNLTLPIIRLSPPKPTLHKYPALDDQDNNDEDGIVLSFHVMRKDGKASTPGPRIRHTVERPGLRQSRTLSGYRHVWRRPSFHIHTVEEERCAETAAESGELTSCGQT